MKYFNVEREEIRNVVDWLLKICEDMGKVENNKLDLEFVLESESITDNDKERIQRKIDNIPKLQEDIGIAFQKELSKIIDLTILPKDITDGILDTIKDKVWEFNKTEREQWFNDNCKVPVPRWED